MAVGYFAFGLILLVHRPSGPHRRMLNLWMVVQFVKCGATLGIALRGVIPDYLSSLGGNLYQATLPATSCAAQPQFYVSAQGSGGSTVTEPGAAPATVNPATMGGVVTRFGDTFQTDLGWTVSGSVIGPPAGQWQRGIPANGEDHIAAVADQPQSGFLPLGGVVERRNVLIRSLNINIIIHNLHLRSSLPGGAFKEAEHVAFTLRSPHTGDGANEA